MKEPQYLMVANEKGAMLVLLIEDMKLVAKAKFEEDGIVIKVNILRAINRAGLQHNFKEKNKINGGKQNDL